MATTKKTSNLGQPVNSTGKSSGNTKEKDISFSDPAKEAWLRTLYSTGSYEQADSAAYSTNHTSGAPLAPVESTSSRLYQNMQNGSVERRADGRYYVTSPTTQMATRTPTAAESYADRLLSTTAANSATGMQDRWAGLSRDFGEDALENAFKQSGLSREEFYQQAVEKDRVNNSKNIGLNLETGLGKAATRVAEAAGLIKAYLKNGGDTESEGYKASADRINNLIAEANQRQNERASERIYNQAAGEITLDYAKQHRWDDAAQAAALDPNKIAEGKRMVQAAAEENARKVSEYEATFEEPRDSSWLRSRILENSNAARKLNEWSESHDFNKSLVNREEYLPKDGWTEEEENLHAYLYATDKALADEYAADINDRINAGKAKEKLASVTDDGVSAGEWVKAQAAKLLTIPETIERKFEYAATGRVNVPEAPTLMQYAEAVDQAISDKLNGYDSTTGEYTKTLRDDIPVIGGKGVGDLYQLGMSILQSTAAGLTGPMGTTAIFYSSAAESAYQQALERGATYGQALVYADMNGIFEGLFEALSIDKIKGLANAAADTGSFRKLLKAAGASFLIEGSEEINTSMADLLADAFVMQGKSEAAQNIESMMAQGMSYEEAYKQNLKNTVNSLLYDGLAGGISGAAHTALFGGTRNMANAVMPYGAENTQQLLETARAREAEGYPVIGLAGAEQQVANRQARYDARGNGRKASLTRREAQNLKRSFLDTYGGAEGYVRAIAEEARVEQAEHQAEAEKTAARRKAGLGEGSSYSVNKGDATISVLNSDEAGNDIGGETTDFRITGMARENGRNVVRFANENGETESVAVEDAGEAIGGDAGRFIRRLNAELGEYAPGAYELYEDGQDVDDYITLMDRAINLYAKNGADVRNITQGVMAETLTPAQLLFAQSAGNRLNTAERAEANRTAAELKQAVASAREASDFVALSRTRRQIEGYIKSLKQTRQQLTTALAGLDEGADAYETISARIEALDAKIASNESLLEGVKEDIADAQKREHKGKKGSVSLNGGKADGRTYDPVKKELSKKQKAVVEMAEVLADILPLNFTFYEAGARDNQGFIIGDTIYVNINSGMVNNTVLGASTIAHELTHFISQNAHADYIELRDYLVNKFVEKNGQEAFDRVISREMKGLMKDRVSPEEAQDRAVEEFVCNACEDMLMDSKAVQRLAHENMSLFEKVKKWIEQTIAKIKAAYEDLDTFRAEAVFGRTLDGLQEIWDNALVNATRNFNATAGSTRAQVSANENAAPESDVKFQAWTDENDTVRKQILFSQTEIDSMAPVATIDSSDMPKDDVRKIRKWAEQKLKYTGYTVDRQGFGEIVIDGNHINQALNHLLGKKDEMVGVLALPRVLKRGLLIENHEEHKNRTPDSFTFAAPIEIDGARATMGVVVQRTTKNFYHAHRVLLPGGVSFTFENIKNAESKPSGELPGNQALIAETIDSASANNIAQRGEQSKTKYQAWDGELTYDSLRDMQTELNSTIDSISKIEKSGEYNRLIKAALSDTDGEALQAFLDYSESSGLNRLVERRKELEEGISSGTTQLDSQQDEKTLADYSRAVEASGLSEEDYRRKEAHDEFGYTTNFKEAGYMLPDGKLLDFSGKREGGPRGYRSMDHRSISRIYPSLNSDDGMGTDKLIRFVSEGNIRLMPELPGIEISAEKPLTNEQYSGIRRMIQTLADDYMSVDIMAEKGNIAGHLEYEGTVRPDRVINDLKHYYETGEVREQGLSAYYQKWSEDQFSLFDEKTGRLHPELQRRIDEAEKLKGDLKRFFSGGDYSEHGITDEMIEDSLDINLYAAAGESDADVDNVFMALNEISKDIGRDEREKVYELMRGLTRHMKASQAARWQGYGNRNDKAPNEGFADWNRAKDGFVNFGRTRAVSSSMLSDEERAYMEREFNAILNDESASAELKEDARRNLKRLNNRNAVWYQKWEDGQELFDMVDELADVKSAEYQKWSEDTGDTAKEAANRDRAFATMKAENESLRDIVNSLRAELKESTKLQNRAEAKLERAERQTRRTEVPEVRPDDAKKIARSLIKRFESGTDANDIAARIKELGDYIVSVTGETVDYDTIKSMARDIAYEVLSDVNVPLERENLDLDDRQAIASAIKGRRFTVMQQDKGELDVEGGYNDFRKKNFGKFTLVNEGGESIDSAYTELQNTYGTVYFPEVNSPGEMIAIMADLVDNAEPVMGNPYEDYMAEATEQAANDIIYDAIGETLRQMPETLADKLAKAKAVSRAELRAARNAAKEDRSAAVAKERAAARARYEALQERSAKRIAEIKAEGKARVQEVRAHEKAEKWKKVKSIHDYYLEKEERAREARNEAASVTQYKERIIRKATNLMDRVTANTGKKHVPEALRVPLAEFLSTIRFDSKRSLAGGPETQNDLAMAERMSDLADVLAQQKNYQDGAQDAADIMGAYLDLPDGIIEQMRDIARNARDYIRRAGGDYTINTMNSLELRALDQTLDVITAAVNGLNRFHENNVYNHVDEAGASTIRELGELPEISARLRKAGERGSLNPDNFLSWANTVPIYAFKRYGAAGAAMFDEIVRGWGKMAVNAKKVIDFAASAYSEEEAKTWDKEKKTLTYIDAAGEPVSVEMSVSELMTLYELLKRSQARQHIFGGGIQVPSSSSEHYAVDGRIIAELEQVLTQRQRDVADTLQKYMQDEGGRLGNEVTMARWGISSFGEEHYFPIETESTDRNASGQEASPMRSQDLYRLMNMGFTKSLNKYANNAVVIRPIFDVFANHMADMVKYNALTMPMLDMMKWYNYRERTDVEGSGTAFLTDSVQRSIERAYGKGANGYFINFMKDMNGVKEGGRGEAGLKAFMSNYKVAQIGFNLRVVMQQPTSIARAALDINPKYLIEGVATKGDREEMLKYSGIAVWKIALGFYDVNINSSMRQQIKHTDSLKDKVQNASTWAAGKADEVTWAAMWRACKAEQRDLGYTGEELIERTVDRFDHLMLSTQVMDSTISRSQLMRNPSAAVSEYTGFMSEPTLSYNTLLDAYMDFRGEMRKKGFDAAMKNRGGRMVKAVLVWQISEALVSAVAAIADVARDDDEYETFLQKWLEHFADNYKDNANPLNLLPGISDFVEFARNKQTGSGYRDVSMVTAGVDKLATFVTDAVKKISGKYKGYKTDWGIYYEGMQAVGMIGGIPIAPIAREFTALHNGFVTIYNDTLGIEYDDRLNYWKTYDEGEKAAIKSAVENGYLDDEAAANALVEADAYDSTEKASQAVYEWSVKAEGYDSKYGKLYEAVMAGDSAAAEAAREKLIDYDYTDDQISDTVKKKVEEWYTDPATQFDRQQAIDALTRYAGMEYTDADSKLSYWFFKSENPDCGNTQKSMGPALRASESRGIITRAEARKIWQGVKAGTQGEWTKTYDEWLSEN